MQNGKESQYCEFLEFLEFLGRPMNFLGRGSSWVLQMDTCSARAPRSETRGLASAAAG